MDSLKQDINIPETIRPFVNSKKIADIYESIPTYIWEMSDEKFKEWADPNKFDWRLRVRFWQLFRQGLMQMTRSNKIITIPKIHEGICSYNIFSRKMNDFKRMCFMLRPIQDYSDEIETMLGVTYDKVWDIINMDIRNERGDINVKKAELLLKVHERLVDRKFGAVKQQIEMKKLQVNVNTSNTEDNDLHAIEERIRRLDESERTISTVEKKK